MKVIATFSSKGGTCKSTINMLLASYIKYKLHQRVLVLDFDTPEYNLSYTRKREVEYLQAHNKQIDSQSFYPIEEVTDVSPDSVKALGMRLQRLKSMLDYVILDFPGSFMEEDAVIQLAKAKVIDHIIIPVELDGMIIASAKILAELFQQLGQKTTLFFNRVHGKEKPELYYDLEQWFLGKGIRISSHRIKSSIKMKRDVESGSNFMRSTVCFPDKEILENNPAIIDLFQEVLDDK